MSGELRVLIVEDSAVVSMLLKALIDSEPGMAVVGVARDGGEGVKLARELRPDVITMDIRMPVMDGFLATREIMASAPTPIVVISSSVDAEELRITFRAIEEGALAVLEKPHGVGHPDFECERRRIVDTLRAMAEVRVVRRSGRYGSGSDAHVGYRLPSARNYQVLALAASTGGPQVLKRLFDDMPAHFPLPVLVVQHISPGFLDGMASWLNLSSRLTVRVAEQGERLEPGKVLFAREGRHMVVTRTEGGALAVNYIEGPEENYQCPSADPLFRSLASVCGHRSLGGILTGMGEDGARGLLAVRDAGGGSFVQSPESCVVGSMPESAIALGAVEHTLALGQIPLFLSEVFAPSGSEVLV